MASECADLSARDFTALRRIDCAVVVKPTPGDELEIALTARSRETLPAGDFVIQPYWGGYEKDGIVGAMVDTDLRPYLLGTGAVGIVLLIASSILAFNSSQRRQRP